MTTAAHPATSPLAPADSGATLVEHLRRQLRTRPGDPCMRFMAGGRWVTITWGQFGDALRRIAAFLAAEGVAEQEHVAIWASNRPEWHIADAAVLTLRCRPVPVYLTLSAEQAAYVLAHSEARVIVVENSALLARLQEVRSRVPSLRRAVVMEGLDAPTADGFAIPWTQALRRGEEAAERLGSELERRAVSVTLDDVATLIYTSGTTGPPKAVMLTHGNVAAATAALVQISPSDETDRVISYLPLAHIAERMVSEFRSYVFGNVTYFAAGMDRLAEHLQDVRPTVFLGVPRVWEKMAAALRGRLDAAPGAKGRLARWAVRAGMRHAEVRRSGAIPGPVLRRQHALADRLVLRRLREAIGLDQARILGSGAAPIDPEVLRFFDALGLEIDEVYGQTEDTGVATMNRPGQARFGTVGPPLPGVEVVLAEDGEILVRGGVVFAGYHKDPEATAAALTEDGFLRTGDVGELDADGFLRITDRKKDLIITAGGKNIAPSNIETALTRHPLVANAVVIGDRRPYVTALLTLDAEAAVALARERGLAVSDPAELAATPAVREELERHVAEVNRQLSGVEAVKRWTVLPRAFEIGVELTPTLKVRRKVVNERYAEAIASLYPGVTNA